MTEAVHEVTFAADVASWINSILESRADLPFKSAKIEKSARGRRTRRDLTIYDRDGNKALTGEIKMPDAPDGRSPYAEDVVQDAFKKASEVGGRYFFTWNVNRFVLWDPGKVKLPILQRQCRDYSLFKLRTGDEVESPQVVDKLRNEFLPRFLEEFAALYRGETPFGVLPPDQRFVMMLEAFLDRPVELTRYEIYHRWRSRVTFRKDLSNWMVERQKWTIPHGDLDLAELLDRAAKLCCYVLATKLVFYEALRSRFPALKPIKIAATVDSSDRLYGLLSSYFENAQCITNDYETIFWPDYGAKVPLLADGAVDAWKSVVEQITLFNLRNLGYDVLGPIFQRLIDKDEKHKYGQYYTDPYIVDLINAFTIRSADSVVLDPGCGSGTFLVRAYARKRWLNPTLEHPQALSQIYGIDWSGLAVHLSALSLASQDLIDADNYPRVARKDFFDVAPESNFMTLPKPTLKSGGLGSKQVEIKIPHTDTGIGNPPYIRQEDINKSRKKAYQNLVRREAPGFSFSGRSDIYVYFWPHLASFLKPGSYLGLLTSSSWLDVDYGFRLQKWFLENFRILAVIESTVEVWFEDARVLTSVTIIQPCSDEAERMGNPVRFVQLRVPITQLLGNDGTEDGRQRAAERLRDSIMSTDRDVSTDQWRILVRTQQQLWDEGCRISGLVVSDLEEDSEEREQRESIKVLGSAFTYVGGKWGRYLRAPDLYFELMEKYGGRFKPLGEIAIVRRGVTSGCDDFFFPRDHTKEALQTEKSPNRFKEHFGVSRSAVESGKVRIVQAGDDTVWPIEAEFLEPELHSLMNVQAVVVKPENLDRLILLVNKTKADLRNTLVLEYIKYGENETFGGDHPVSERSTCKTRPLWYDLTGGKSGDAFWPMIQKYRHLIPANPEYGEGKEKKKLICNHNLFDVASRDRTLAGVLAAVLNSTIVAFFKNFYGRYAGMEGTLKTEVVDVKMLPIPDIRRANKRERTALEKVLEKMSQRGIDYFLEDAFLEMIPLDKLEKLAATQPTLPTELRHPDRQELDRVVLNLIGVPSAEIPGLLDRLYKETALVYRRGRVLDIRTAANKRGAKRAGSASPSEIADSVLDSLPAGTIKTYPRDFLTDSEPVDHYAFPHNKAKLIEDLFHNPRLRFKNEEIEFRHLEQAELALVLHNAGMRGPIAVPADRRRCLELQSEWNAYWKNLNTTLQDEVSQRTPDEDKIEAAVSILCRRALST